MACDKNSMRKSLFKEIEMNKSTKTYNWGRQGNSFSAVSDNHCMCGHTLQRGVGRVCLDAQILVQLFHICPLGNCLWFKVVFAGVYTDCHIFPLLLWWLSVWIPPWVVSITLLACLSKFHTDSPRRIGNTLGFVLKDLFESFNISQHSFVFPGVTMEMREKGESYASW